VTLAARVACLGVLLAAACNPFAGERRDPADAVRRYVAAWPAGGEALARTLTGADAEALARAVAELGEDGVVRATVADVRADGDAVDAVVALHFADRGRLETAIRAVIVGGRVRAAPAAVSTLLTRFERVRVEAYGAPRRGALLSRGGTVLASGPRDGRVLARPGLAPAVALADEALDERVGAVLGRRLLAGDPPRVLADAPPRDGEDTATSLDDAMQGAAERLAEGLPGAFVAVDPGTGGIRALVSTPEPDAPGRSPASSAYSPGSTFKIVTAAAALDEGVVAPDGMVACPARRPVGERVVANFEDVAYGDVTFEKAFAVSCNTAFARVGLDVGTPALLQTAGRLGFPAVRRLDDAAAIAPPLSRAELAVWSFGADGTLVTPLHMAGVAATIGRDGREVSAGWTDEGRPGRRVLRRETAAALVTMMEAVVRDGTGARAAVPGTQVAGKTGTADARRAGAAPDGWFVGLAPSRAPRVAVVAFLPASGLGGEVAASLSREFLLATEAAWKPQ
jgi:peptidoglycan glycosyltransferase